MFLVDFQFLLAQSQYHIINIHLFSSEASKFSHVTVIFLKLSRIEDSLNKPICDNTVLLSGLLVLVICQRKLNPIVTEELCKANNVLDSP